MQVHSDPSFREYTSSTQQCASLLNFFGTRYGKTASAFIQSNPRWILVSKGMMTSQYVKYFNSVKPPVLLDAC